MADYVATKPDFTIGVWAEQGELSQPSADKIETGHIVEKPPFQLANWIENRQDQGLYYLFQNGLASWQNNMFYPQYAIVSRNGVVYQALQQNNGQDPLSATDYWIKAFYSKTDGDSLKAVVQKIQNEDGFLTLYVKKSDPVMDSTAKGVGYAFKDYDTTGLFVDSNGNTVVKKNGKETHSFQKINDVSSEDNDKVVTMADLKIALGKLQTFAVGSIYINTGNNPNSDLGYGTWEKFGQGKTLVGQSDSGDDPNWVRTNLSSYGSYNKKITVPFTGWGNDGKALGSQPAGKLIVGSGANEYKEYLESLNGANNNQDFSFDIVQPSIVVTFWKRTS